MTDEELENLQAEFAYVVEQLQHQKRLLKLSSHPVSRRLLRDDAKFLIARFIRRNFPEVIAHEKDPRFSDAKNIAIAIQPWYPLFGISAAEKDEFDQFFQELWTMGDGDEPSLLKPKPRKKSEHRRRYQLAICRLSALQWHAFLRARGLQLMQFRPAIELAYGSDWDTMKQWRQKAVPKVIERWKVDALISRAAQGREEFLRFPDYHDPLRESGARYRALKGWSILTPAEFHRKLENSENQLPARVK